MELPYVDPVGVVHHPEGYTTRARRLPVPVRVFAAVLLVVFALVATVTTAASLGRYCITSHASDARPLQTP